MPITPIVSTGQLPVVLRNLVGPFWMLKCAQAPFKTFQGASPFQTFPWVQSRCSHMPPSSGAASPARHPTTTPRNAHKPTPTLTLELTRAQAEVNTAYTNRGKQPLLAWVPLILISREWGCETEYFFLVLKLFSSFTIRFLVPAVRFFFCVAWVYSLFIQDTLWYLRCIWLKSVLCSNSI